MIKNLGDEIITIIHIFIVCSSLVLFFNAYTYYNYYVINNFYEIDNSLLDFIYFFDWIIYWVFLLGIIWFVHNSQLYNFKREVKNLKYSPNWVGIWWFIPIVNLWMPYKVVKETYLSSFQVKKIKLDHEDSSKLSSWWSCWIIGNTLPVIFGVTIRTINRVQGIDLFSSHPQYIVEVTGTLFIIFSALFFIPVIKKISENETITLKE